MRTRLSEIVVWFAGASLLVVACYNPNIAQGGFQCGAKNACPQNFHCASDNKCYRGDAGPTDAGVACESPPPTPSCSIDAGSDQTCNPGCQRGCECGWCAISGGTASCSTAKQGTTALGQVCDPTATTNPCKPGLFCQSECRGVGRCYQVCNADHECNTTDAGTSTCSLTASGSAFHLCTMADCDPFKVTGSGCPTGSACYVLFPQTFCGCVGTKAAGATCVNTADCQPGYTCIGPVGNSHCEQLCNDAHPCASDGGSASCQPVDSFGYCM